MSCIQNNQTYTLKNCKGGTVLDLSGGDNYSIIGYNNHNGPNQSWVFERIDAEGWLIKSAGSDKWLGIQGEPWDIKDGNKVVAVSSPFKWKVENSNIPGVEGIRILAHGTNFSVDLSDNGNSKEGTEVQLWGSWQGANQIWAVESR
ncbi:carbohydrate-binding module family 13 protein [Suillus ampliporus]|nr:carbohydrate-binding module family 13 protein [Suillus ampliporus]